MVKLLSSTSRIPGSIPGGNEFLDWVKKISSPLHTPKHRLRPGPAVVTGRGTSPVLTWDSMALV
jgi:hypothetical protein